MEISSANKVFFYEKTDGGRVGVSRIEEPYGTLQPGEFLVVLEKPIQIDEVFLENERRAMLRQDEDALRLYVRLDEESALFLLGLLSSYFEKLWDQEDETN